MHFDLFDPIFNIVEGGAVIDCISEHYPHGSPIIGLRDGLKSLLAGGVPNLQFDPGSI